MANDISDDDLTSRITADERQNQFNTELQQHRFRRVAFYGSCAIIVLFLLALLFWLVWWPLHSLNLNEIAAKEPGKYADFIAQTKTLWSLGIIMLAAIPTTLALALALLRFAFSKDKKKKESDAPGILLSLAKEIADIIKDYIKKKS